VVVFSHGLGGTRNAYSHILGSLASHGVVVIAPEHRDGSCPISTIQGGNSVEYKHLPHTKAKGVLDEREQQLKVRLWELGLVYDALLKMEDGNPIQNFRKDDSAFDMSVFRNTLNVYEPGSITWAGHSFGAATSVQFVKSVFYRPPQNERSYHPLYVTAPDSQLSKQITPRSSLDLLDIWMLPILSDTTAWLRNKPLPCYTDPTIGGSNVLSILSEAFFKWQANFVEMKRIVSDDPTGEKRTTQGQKQPHIFYPATSAHLSQSDFGVLFPRLVKIGLKALEPERAIRLNVRAMLEVMRIAGAEVANTSDVDMELAGNHFDKAKQSSIHDTGFGAGQDSGILKTDGSVRGWISLSVKAEDESVGEGKNAKSSVANGPSDMVN
jgi:platelet-activating factor acetylhydrolase